MAVVIVVVVLIFPKDPFRVSLCKTDGRLSKMKVSPR